MIEVTPFDKSIDVPQRLREIDDGIAILEAARVRVPSEAIEIRTILRRCIVAEADLARWQRFASYCRSCAMSGENDPIDIVEFTRREQGGPLASDK